MTTIQASIQALGRSERKAEAAAAALKTAKARRADSLKNIRAAIRKGRTTGDIAEDLMYLQGGDPDPAVAEFFRTVQAKIAGKTGSLVVIAMSTRISYSEDDPELMEQGITRIYGGVLTGDRLLVDRQYGHAQLPTKSHLMYLGHLNREDEGPISFDAPRPKPYTVYKLDMYVGDEIYDLYASHFEFRDFVLEQRDVPYWGGFLNAFPTPQLVLAA